eukprot:6482167-Amphidinium_carterae.1
MLQWEDGGDYVFAVDSNPAPAMATCGDEEKVQVFLDCACFDHACPPWFATHVPLVENHRAGTIRSAKGDAITRFGERHVVLRSESGRCFRVCFQVLDISKVLVSLGALLRNSSSSGKPLRVVFTHAGCKVVTCNSRNTELLHFSMCDTMFVADMCVTKGKQMCTNAHASSEGMVLTLPHDTGARASTDDAQPHDTGARASTDDAHMVEPNEVVLSREMGEEELGRERARARAQPKGPGLQERQMHALTHIPFRSWCDACVQGRSRANTHPRVCEERQRDRVPVIQVDYTFPMGFEGFKVLSMIDTSTHYVALLPVESKGPSDQYAVRFLAQFLSEVGHSELQIQHDPEDALEGVVTRAAAKYHGRVRIRSTPKGSSESNGAVERYHRSAHELLRTYRAQLEMHTNVNMRDIMHVYAWMTRHVGWTHCRFHVAATGRTGFANVAGTGYAGEVAMFGEAVLVHIGAEARHKADLQWTPGIWVGKTSHSDEHIVLRGGGGVITSRSIRRRPAETCWDGELLKSTRATPWNSGGVVVAESPAGPAELAAGPAMTAEAQSAQRTNTPAGVQHGQFLDEMGPTPGCGACEGRRGFHHTVACRHRREEWMRDRERSNVAEAAIPETATAQAEAEPGVAETAAPMETETTSTLPVEDVRRRITSKRPAVQHEDAEGRNKFRLVGMVAEGKVIMSVAPEESEEPSGIPPDEVTLDAMDDVSLQRKAAEIEATVIDIKAAVADELSKLQTFKVCEVRDRSEKPSGAEEYGTTMVLANRKGKVKARICAQDFRMGTHLEEHYSPTPTAASLRLVLVLALQLDLVVWFGDFSSAFLHVPLDDEVWVRPPLMLNRPSGEMWRLRKALYGLRRAPKGFHAFVQKVLGDLGFYCTKSDCCVFRHEQRVLFVLAHVDDPVMVGSEGDIKWLCAKLKEQMYFNPADKPLGKEPQRFLGKLYARDGDTITITHPKGYEEGILRDLNLLTAKGVSTPGSDSIRPQTNEEKEQWDEPLLPQDAYAYRAVLGKLRYMAQERPDIGHELGILSKAMAAPALEHWHRLRRVGRYLAHTLGTQLVLRKHTCARTEPLHIRVYSDSDHAGDQITRKSVSSAVIFANENLLHTHSRKQTLVSTSSCEAELYAACGAMQEALMIRSLCLELKVPCRVTLYSDSSSARSIIHRQGLTRCKHIDIKYLWLQEVLSTKQMELKSVPTQANPADIGTKRLPSGRLRELASKCGLRMGSPDAVVWNLVDECQGRICSSPCVLMVSGVGPLEPEREPESESQNLRKRSTDKDLGKSQERGTSSSTSIGGGNNSNVSSRCCCCHRRCQKNLDESKGVGKCTMRGLAALGKVQG